MEAKLYVGNLSYNTSEDDLRDLFAQAGTVKSATLIRDRDTGRSKGFAFVEMETQEEAEKAISQFHGTQFQDRALTVWLVRVKSVEEEAAALVAVVEAEGETVLVAVVREAAVVVVAEENVDPGSPSNGTSRD